MSTASNGLLDGEGIEAAHGSLARFAAFGRWALKQASGKQS
jgi:hypothetical protein